MRKFNLFHTFVIWVAVYSFSALLLSGCSSNPIDSGASSIDTPTATEKAPPYIFGKLVNSAGAPVGGADVQLLDTAGKAVAGIPSVKSLPSGEYAFEKIKPGVYFVSASAPGYSDGAILVQAGQELGNKANDLLLVPLPTSPVEATVDIQAILKSRDQGWSTALVTSDSGQTAISTATGSFVIKYLPAGSRSLTFTKPGILPFRVQFTVSGESSGNDVDGRAIANSVLYEGRIISSQNYLNLGSGARVADLDSITAPYTFHDSSAFTGTVFSSQRNDVTGRVDKLPKAFYTFELWMADTRSIFSRFRTVQSDSQGRWQVDNIPSQEDNQGLWFVTETGAAVVLVGDDQQLTRQLTGGFRAKPGLTTVIDIAVP